MDESGTLNWRVWLWKNLAILSTRRDSIWESFSSSSCGRVLSNSASERALAPRDLERRFRLGPRTVRERLSDLPDGFLGIFVSHEADAVGDGDLRLSQGPVDEGQGPHFQTNRHIPIPAVFDKPIGSLDAVLEERSLRLAFRRRVRQRGRNQSEHYHKGTHFFFFYDFRSKKRERNKWNDEFYWSPRHCTHFLFPKNEPENSRSWSRCLRFGYGKKTISPLIFMSLRTRICRGVPPEPKIIFGRAFHGAATNPAYLRDAIGKIRKWLSLTVNLAPNSVNLWVTGADW